MATSGRVFEARVLDGGAHALARLLHLGVGEPDDGEGRQAAAEVHLDGDFRRIRAGEGAAPEDGERHDAGKFNRAPGSAGEPAGPFETSCSPGRGCQLFRGKLKGSQWKRAFAPAGDH